MKTEAQTVKDVTEIDVPTQVLRWHGNEVVFHRCGDGQPVLLIHGIAGSFDTWNGVLPEVGRGCMAVAPDLLGHGRSTKPRGDYSLGAFATGLRDLMEALDIPSATIVGHSLGGGIAMQFAYQYPERCQRLVLVDSGGLGPEVTSLLRAATLPGSDLVINLATSDRAQSIARGAMRQMRKVGLPALRVPPGIAHHFLSLRDRDARRAFVATARSVMDLRGQRIDARDRLYLAAELPTMVIWGRRDRIIPVAHGIAAHEMMPGSRLEIFHESGHFPQEQEPRRFAEVLLDFINSTEPAQLSLDVLRNHALKDGPPATWEPAAEKG
ncbi:MAG TPA: alpha/beta fold hydrolase [Actinomycetota bacterium]|nr:alpha/beta fold hydrolase [Actinomycetota bacterium]